ncbi:hypothetical protein Daus18300_011519 [Diaporthe australafricana]|uniref:Uncharacterized protein n=1 Tax=Diaporthe australafricana TaxID=127596 RepID=A0ABR3W6A3_9PEZI
MNWDFLYWLHVIRVLEDLVTEFEEEAVKYIQIYADGSSFFPKFWNLFWQIRMEEELGKLEGNELTDAERRDAEEIGVQWSSSQQKEEEENPYRDTDLKYWFYELDKICPEYAEPWPEELCRVAEIPDL